MRVLHAPFGYYPDQVGGTEIYVKHLCHELLRLGSQVAIAAPSEVEGHYNHDGIQVHRFAVSQQVRHIRELYDGIGDEQSVETFTAVLEQEKPNIVHFHAFNRALSLGSIAAARRSGAVTVFTYHLPGVSCQRGTLLRWGRDLCDGQLRARLCAACALHSHGLPKVVSQAVALMPTSVGRLIGAAGLMGGPWTALQMHALLTERHTALRKLMAQVDTIIVLCDWAQALLINNGMDAAKIILSRHGMIYAEQAPHERDTMQKNGLLRVAFVGRMYPIKGPDVLIRALRHNPSIAVQLDLYGYAQEAQGEAYIQYLRSLADQDPRIRFYPGISNQQVIPLLADYDLLAVPSQWLETGPLVVLEAFAAGTPVLGSRLGGITELVSDNIDGILVEHASIQAWSAILNELARDRSRVARLRAGVKPPRTMSSVAQEMLQIYQLLHDQRQSLPVSE